MKPSKDNSSDSCLPSTLVAMLNYLLQVLTSLKRTLVHDTPLMIQRSLSESDHPEVDHLPKGDQLPNIESETDIIDEEVVEDDESADEESVRI